MNSYDLSNDWWNNPWAFRNWLFQKPLISYCAMLESHHAFILSKIHRESFAEGWSETDFERMLTDKTIIADGLFIGRDIHPKGFILSRYVFDEAEILTIALDRSVRSRRLSKKLLREHIAILERKGIHHVFLEVDEQNIPAVSLYRSLNFQQIGERKGYYRKKNGQTATALMMKLEQ